MIVLGSAAAGAIALPVLQSLFWPGIEAPAWLLVGNEGMGGTATGIGAVLGFVAALLCAALHRRLSGIRALNTYPPVRMARRAGWQYPE